MKGVSPEGMTEDDDVGSSRLIVGGVREPAELRLDAEQWKELGRDFGTSKGQRFSLPG